MITKFLTTHGSRYFTNVARALKEAGIKYDTDLEYLSRSDVVTFYVNDKQLTKAHDAVTKYYLDFKDMDLPTNQDEIPF